MTYINAQSVCQLLIKLAELSLQVPITLVLDNARYQRCALVQSVADSLGIELLYLPPYSPNLNLIERLWKLVKKHCLYSKYYADFTAFTHARTYAAILSRSRAGNGVWGFLRMRWRLNRRHVIPRSKRSRSTTR